VPAADPEFDSHATDRLTLFSDAVVAIAITLLAIDLPVPSGATAGEFWSSARVHDGVYLSLLVSFLTIAVAWSHHHDAFKYARRTDGWMRNATMVWLLTIILIPSATKLLTGAGQETTSVHALRWGFYALLQTVQATVLFAMTRHMAAHDLGRQDADGRAGAESDWQSYGTILGFGLSIPVFFATTYGWVLWIVTPMAVHRLDRLRRRRDTDSPDGSSPEPPLGR
jgi:uncharacterized membrane protein